MRRLREHLRARRCWRENVMASLGRLERAVAVILNRTERMMPTLDEILEKVTATKGQVDSLITLTSEIAQLVRDNASNPAKLQEIADQIDAAGAAAAAAVAANSDVDPTP